MGGVHVSREAGNPRESGCLSTRLVVQVQLFSLVLDWAKKAIARQGRPVHVSSSQREGQTQTTTIVSRSDRAGSKVSGPRQSGGRQSGEMLCKTGGTHCVKKETTGGL